MDTQGNPGDRFVQPDDGSIIHYYRSGFGRGWIPAGRDVGIPGDAEFLPGTGRGTADAVGGGGAGADEGLTAGSESPPVPLHHPVDGPPPRAGEEWGGRHDGWTPVRKARFLDHLASQGNVRVACAAVGMSPEAAYKLRRREAVFAAAWAGALVLAREAAEQVLADRALHGVSEPIFYRGEQVGSRVKYDTRLLLAHLSRLDAAARDAAAQASAERFDELVALVAGAEVDPAMLGKDGLPLTREAYAEQAADEAEEQAAWDRAARDADEEDGALVEDEEDGDWRDPIMVARHSAHAAAGTAWDDWRARAHAVVDRQECEAPVEFKSLDPVNSINFVNFAGWRTGGSGLPVAASAATR